MHSGDQHRVGAIIVLAALLLNLPLLIVATSRSRLVLRSLTDRYPDIEPAPHLVGFFFRIGIRLYGTDLIGLIRGYAPVNYVLMLERTLRARLPGDDPVFKELQAIRWLLYAGGALIAACLMSAIAYSVTYAL